MFEQVREGGIAAECEWSFVWREPMPENNFGGRRPHLHVYAAPAKSTGCQAAACTRASDRFLDLLPKFRAINGPRQRCRVTVSS